MTGSDAALHYVIGVIAPITGGVGILFNSVILITLIKRQEQTRIWYLLFFMTLAHLFVAGFHSTLAIIGTVAAGLGRLMAVFIDPVCSVLGVCSYMIDNVPILLLAVAAIDRCRAITTPARYGIRRTLSKWYKFAIGGCFLLPALFGLLALPWGFTFELVAGKCVVGQHHIIITTSWAILFRLGPILVILTSVLKQQREFKVIWRQNSVPTEPVNIEQAQTHGPVSFVFPNPNISDLVAPFVSALELRAAKSMMRLFIVGVVLGSFEMVLMLLGMDLIKEMRGFQGVFTLSHSLLIPLLLLTQKNAFNATWRRLTRRCYCHCNGGQRNVVEPQIYVDPSFQYRSNNDLQNSCSIDDRLPDYLKRPHTVDMCTRIKVDVSTVEADPAPNNRATERRKESEHLLHPRGASLQTGSHRTFENDDISSIDSLRVMIDADKWSLSACSTITLSRPDRPDHRPSVSFHPRRPSQFSMSSERKQAKLSNAYSHNFAVEIRGSCTPSSPRLGIVTDSYFSASLDHPESPTSPSSRVTRWMRSSGTGNRPRAIRTCVSLQENISSDISSINISSSNSSSCKDGSPKSTSSQSPTRVSALKRHTLCHSPSNHTDLPSVEQISPPLVPVIRESVEC